MSNIDVLPYAVPVTGFRSRKAAQICAWFAHQNDNKIERLKLIKLIYFAERQFLSEHHLPMLFDEFYSLYNGPICSSTLNGMNGVVTEPSVWDEYISRNGNLLYPVSKIEENVLDEVSAAEWDVLYCVWDKFGSMTASQLRNYSHEHCPEYTQVAEGSRLPISYKDVLSAFYDPEAAAVDEEIKQIRLLEA